MNLIPYHWSQILCLPYKDLCVCCTVENVPPTLNALFQKVKRSILVATFMWNQCLSRSQNLPSPQFWGWEWNSRMSIWVPYWTDIPDASHGCSLLIHCGCQSFRQGRCKCFKMGISCGPFCKCQGSCTKSISNGFVNM